MYTIGNIICGSPVGVKAGRWIREKEEDMESLGLKVLYSGTDDYTPAYCGVELGTIDSTTDAVAIDVEGKRMGAGETVDSVKWFSMVPTKEQRDESESLFAGLPEGLRAVMPPIGVYLVWSNA